MAEAAQTRARPSAPPRPRREREEEVLVWPDLVFTEFIAATLFTLTFVILSFFVNAPLLNRANANVTPNPSKAPWYFMNLQELLLHMNPALAGVIVPTIAIIALAVIPYFDRDNEAQGEWFGTINSVRLTVVSWFYGIAISIGLVLMDAGKFGFPGHGPMIRGHHLTEYLTLWIPFVRNPQKCTDPATGQQVAVQALSVPSDVWSHCQKVGLSGIRDFQTSWKWHIGKLDWPADFTRIPLPFNNLHTKDWFLRGFFNHDKIRKYFYWDNLNINFPAVLVEQIIPIAFMVSFPILLFWIMHRIGWARTVRDFVIIMFSGLLASFITLTIIGAAFRGPGQQLLPPANPLEPTKDQGYNIAYQNPWWT